MLWSRPRFDRVVAAPIGALPDAVEQCIERKRWALVLVVLDGADRRNSITYTPAERQIFAELETRKVANDEQDQCDSCNGTGGTNERVCTDCLGQGLLLYQHEWDLLMTLTISEDSILAAKVIE